MRYIDKIVLSQVAPWKPGEKISQFEKIIFWTFINCIPIHTTNLLLNLKNKKSNPYLPQNDIYKCIYIHIPKNAGTSIQKILFPEYPKVGHKSLLYHKLYNKKKFNDYFKFAFVRNPWDRLVSAYHFLIKGGLNENEPGAKRWAEQLRIKGINSFENFVTSIPDSTFSCFFLNHRHLRPQYLWLTDEKGRLAVDFIGKIENFEFDIGFLKNNLGIINQNKQIKNNSTAHDYYKNLYTNRMKKIVEDYYKKDISLFGYRF